MQKTSLSPEGMKGDVLETSAIRNTDEDVQPLGDSQYVRLSIKLQAGRYVWCHPLRPSEKSGVDCDRSQSKPDFLDGHLPRHISMASRYPCGPSHVNTTVVTCNPIAKFVLR